jgi:hypothetical protein
MSKMERDTEATLLVHSQQMAKVDETLKVGDKVDHPLHVTLYHGRTRYARVKGQRLEKGDLFSKAKGRELALKRLNESPICLERKEGEHAIDAILRVLSRKDDVLYMSEHGLLRDMAVSSVRRRKAINEARTAIKRHEDRQTSPYKIQPPVPGSGTPRGFFESIKGFFLGY